MSASPVQPGFPSRDLSGSASQSQDEAVDLGQLWGAVKASPKTVLGIAAAVFITVMSATLLGSMEFKTSGQLYLGELDGKSKGGGGDLDISGGGGGDVGSEIEILRSRSSVRSAVLESGLNVVLTPSGWRPPRFWQWLASRRNPALLDVGARTLIALDTRFLEQSHPASTYVVTFTTERDFTLEDAEGSRVRGKLDEPIEALGLHLLLKPGERGTPRAGDAYSLHVQLLDQVVDHASAALKVSTPKGIGTSEPVKVVTLDFAHRSPRGAALFLRRLMDTYLAERQSWKTEDATAAESFVTEQLRGLRESLDKTERKLSDYRSSNGGVVLDGEAQAIVEQLGRFEQQRVDARLQVATLSDMKRALKDPEARIEAFLVGEVDDKVLAEAASNLAKSRQELTAVEGRFQSDAPDVKQQRAQVEAQLSMVRNYVGTRLARAQESLSAMNGVIAQYEAKLKTVPGAEAGLAQLARESEVYARIYTYMLERQQHTAIVKASTVSKNRILDEPQRPFREDSPKLALRAASGMLGLVLGLLVVIVRHLTAATFQSEADVRKAIGVSPILASIPVPKVRNRGPMGAGALHDVLGVDPTSGYAEAFRMLRSGLYQRPSTGAGRVILVTSPSPGDGKTTTALALGAMLAADQKSVVVIDADVRKPSHHELLRTEPAPGLRQVLSGSAPWQGAVSAVSLSYGEMCAIPAGGAGTAEILNGERIAGLVGRLRERFDYVLIDSAAFPLASDALVLSGFVDTVLSIMRLKNTPKATAVRHMRILGAVAADHAVIVNGASDPSGYGTGASYPGRRAVTATASAGA